MSTMTARLQAPAPLFPPLARETLITALLAGIAADLTWEFWARAITPFLPGVGGPLEPAALVQSVFGLDSRLAGEIIHLVVGFVFYPLGYLFVARPIARVVTPGLPWWAVAAGFGVGLWIFALYVMAHLIAGLPAFLGFIPLAWASLAGHVIFGLVVGAVVRLREARA
ncbi:MAG TPA: hypothetical protein VM434_13640 [Beijerinckiaceae bacterium]|nr:hypothetical protein [Beijerinckiaceae bacterium]